jgi:hypothetical protein
VRGSFHGQGGFSFGDHNSRAISTPKTVLLHDVIRGCGGVLNC